MIKQMQAFYNPSYGSAKPNIETLFAPVNIGFLVVGGLLMSYGQHLMKQYSEKSSESRQVQIAKTAAASTLQFVGMMLSAVAFYNFILSDHHKAAVPLDDAELVGYAVLGLVGYYAATHVAMAKLHTKHFSYRTLHVFFMIVGALGAFGCAYGVRHLIQ